MKIFLNVPASVDLDRYSWNIYPEYIGKVRPWLAFWLCKIGKAIRLHALVLTLTREQCEVEAICWLKWVLDLRVVVLGMCLENKIFQCGSRWLKGFNSLYLAYWVGGWEGQLLRGSSHNSPHALLTDSCASVYLLTSPGSLILAKLTCLVCLAEDFLTPTSTPVYQSGLSINSPLTLLLIVSSLPLRAHLKLFFSQKISSYPFTYPEHLSVLLSEISWRQESCLLLLRIFSPCVTGKLPYKWISTYHRIRGSWE